MPEKTPPAPTDVARNAAGNSSVCPGCGAGLRCGMVTGDKECWCFLMPQVIPVPAPAGSKSAVKAGCLCPTCLQLLIDSQP